MAPATSTAPTAFIQSNASELAAGFRGAASWLAETGRRPVRGDEARKKRQGAHRPKKARNQS